MGPADEGLLLQATLASLACVTESVRCERLGGDTTRRSFLLSDPGHIGLRLSLDLVSLQEPGMTEVFHDLPVNRLDVELRRASKQLLRLPFVLEQSEINWRGRAFGARLQEFVPEGAGSRSDGYADWVRTRLAALVAGLDALGETGYVFCDFRPENLRRVEGGACLVDLLGLVRAGVGKPRGARPPARFRRGPLGPPGVEHAWGLASLCQAGGTAKVFEVWVEEALTKAELGPDELDRLTATAILTAGGLLSEEARAAHQVAQAERPEVVAGVSEVLQRLSAPQWASRIQGLAALGHVSHQRSTGEQLLGLMEAARAALRPLSDLMADPRADRLPGVAHLRRTLRSRHLFESHLDQLRDREQAAQRRRHQLERREAELIAQSEEAGQRAERLNAQIHRMADHEGAREANLRAMEDREQAIATEASRMGGELGQLQHRVQGLAQQRAALIGVCTALVLLMFLLRSRPEPAPPPPAPVAAAPAPVAAPPPRPEALEELPLPFPEPPLPFSEDAGLEAALDAAVGDAEVGAEDAGPEPTPKIRRPRRRPLPRKARRPGLIDREPIRDLRAGAELYTTGNYSGAFDVLRKAYWGARTVKVKQESAGWLARVSVRLREVGEFRLWSRKAGPALSQAERRHLEQALKESTARP